MFLMPSRVEPCGTNQLVAMHYGSVPIVRATGGLADTVQNYDPRTGQGTGFVFGNYDPWMLFAAVVRAVETFKHRDSWRQIQLRGMSADFSWDRSARKYVDLYRRAIASRIPRPQLEEYRVPS
jgi:starch synthase